VGFILGVFRLAVDTPVALKDTDFIQNIFGGFQGYEEGSFLWVLNNIYFQYYSLLVFLVSVIVMIVVSYMTEAPSAERIQGLTYATVSAEDKAKSRASWSWGDVAASVAVLLAILAAYLYFNG
jgi:SSS family solute:Na+ symporter